MERAVSAEICLLTIGSERASALTIYDAGHIQQFTDDEDDKLKLHHFIYLKTVSLEVEKLIALPFCSSARPLAT